MPVATQARSILQTHLPSESGIRTKAETILTTSGRCSVADRLAIEIISMLGSKHDLKTIAEWAGHACVSYGSLREHCRLVHIKAHNARDLGRVLRALYFSGPIWWPEAVLDCADSRTLYRILARAGLSDARGGSTPNLLEFLDRQQWAPPGHCLLSSLHFLVRELLCPERESVSPCNTTAGRVTVAEEDRNDL